MQCVALALFHSSPSLKKVEPLKRSSYLRIPPRFHPPSSTSSSDLLTSTSHGVSPCIRSLNLFLSTSRNARFSALSLFFNRTPDSFEVRAASIPGNSSDPAKSTGSIRRLQLGAMFAIWYLVNVYFNIYNKQVLKVYPFPATFTAFQFGCGTAIAALIWAFNLHPRPRITASQLAVILPLALAHTAGNLLTNVSIGKVAVSFTHTIKAMEPFFTVVFATIFLGEKPTPFVVSSLLPVVSGVALASFSEASFNWTGFCCAMASNLTNQSRNVLSKKFMVKKEALDNVNLFSIITSLSFALAVPMAVFMEGIKFSPAYLQSLASRGLDVRALCVRSLLVGICFHSYQQISYMILQMVSPVTHSVGNCVKRVVIIVSSIIFFHTPVSPINSLGIMLALGGVFLYSKAKQMKSKPKST